MFRGPKNETLMNLTVTTFVEIEKLIGIVSIHFPIDDKDKNYGNEALRSTLEMCKVFKRTTGNFLISNLLDKLSERKDFPFDCPLKPHTVRMLNVGFDGMLLPSYLLPGKTKFVSEMKMKAKLPNVKALVYLHTLQFYFESE